MLSRLGVRCEKAEAVLTGVAGPYVLAGRRSRRDMDGPMRDVRRGATVRPSGQGTSVRMSER
jgi:hypothetical protein